MRAVPLRAEDGPAVFKEILEDLPAFWGDRDLRAQHQPVWLRQFAADAVIVREDGILVGYLLGSVTTHQLGYVQLVATRIDHRGRGIGTLLYEAFLGEARRRGARRVEAITSTGNTGSIAFHQRLGFSAEVIPDYSGPGQARVLLRRSLLTDRLQL